MPSRLAAILTAASFATLALLAAFGHPFLLRLDGPVNLALDAVRTQGGIQVFDGLTELGSAPVVAILLALVGVVALLPGRCRRTALVLVLAFAVTVALRDPLKQIVARPRPILDLSTAFPSGHTLMATWFFAMLPVLVSSRLRVAAAILGVGLALVVGFSRIYLGVHWLTDVIGGFLLGSLLSLATYWALAGHRLDTDGCPAGGHGQGRAPPPGRF